MKNTHGSIGAERGILAHSVPHDVVAASQRQRILEALAECCAEKTFTGTTIADIVSCAGVSRRTFYKIFANKRDCFEAAIADFTEEIAAIAATVESREGRWPDTIREAIAEILDLLAAKPTFANLAAIEAVGVDPGLVNRYWDPLVEALKTAPSPAHSPGVPSTTAARAAVGAAQVLIAQRVVTGQTDLLPDLLPDLVYVALAPFIGQEEALEQVRLAR